MSPKLQEAEKTRAKQIGNAVHKRNNAANPDLYVRPSKRNRSGEKGARKGEKSEAQRDLFAIARRAAEGEGRKSSSSKKKQRRENATPQI